MDNNDKKICISLAAIDKTIVQSIPTLTEEEYRSGDYIQYGTDNCFPTYLYGLYTDVSTLKTIIDGTASYVSGDDARCNVPGFDVIMNKKGETLRNIVRLCARDYYIYGGFALEVIRNLKGNVAEVYYVNWRYLRSDKKNESFVYSEDWDKKYVRKTKAITYPKYVYGGDAPASIIYVKADDDKTYPQPIYSGAIKACEIERHIDDMHLNSLENGFMPSYIINLLNGIPSDEQKAELEKDVNEKFCGSSNAGRIMLNFANGKDNMATVQKLDVTDFADKYKAAADRAREQIFTSFRAIPQLFGLMVAATGFSTQEFQESFEVFNSTVIRDMQRVIGDVFDKIFGVKGSITIMPFTLGEQTNVQ